MFTLIRKIIHMLIVQPAHWLARLVHALVHHLAKTVKGVLRHLLRTIKHVVGRLFRVKKAAAHKLVIKPAGHVLRLLKDIAATLVKLPGKIIHHLILKPIHHVVGAVVGLVTTVAVKLPLHILRVAKKHWRAFAVIGVVAAIFTKKRLGRETEFAKEHETPDERDTIEKIIALLKGRLSVQYNATRVLRDTHPKSNGLIKGTFKINPNLPPEHQVGLFGREQKDYTVWMRFSNSAPTVTPDNRNEFRGLGMKLAGVEGEKLIHDEEGTHDFMFVAHDTFFAGTPKAFLSFFALITHYPKTLVPASWRRVPPMLRETSIGALLYPFSDFRGFVNSLVGQNQFGNPLDISWFSIAPFAFGPGKAVKYSVVSSDPPEPIPDDPGPDYLREAMTRTLAPGGKGRTLEFRVQFQTDPAKQPIESTTIAWKEEDSPWYTFATIEIPPQNFNTPERQEFDENIVFNPWHCLPEHRPLGAINRARRDVMLATQTFRISQNDKQLSDVNGPNVPD